MSELYDEELIEALKLKCGSFLSYLYPNLVKAIPTIVALADIYAIGEIDKSTLGTRVADAIDKALRPKG